MNVRLIVEEGAKRGSFSFRSSIAVIGRSRGNVVRIPSADVSRRHCRLTTQDGRVWVEDLGSVNGTLLNGQRINGIEEVKPGDSLTVGPVTFVVEYETGDEEILEAAEIELPSDDPDEVLPVAEELLPEGFAELEEVEEAWPETSDEDAFRDMLEED